VNKLFYSIAFSSNNIVIFSILVSCFVLVWQNLGDLGLVAQASRFSQTLQKSDALTITKVFNTFHLIAKVSYSSLNLFVSIWHASPMLTDLVSIMKEKERLM